jgi:hypothetical protein
MLADELSLLDRDEDRMPDLAFDVPRQVAFSGGVLNQDHLADADHPALTVAGGYLHPGVEIDDVLPTRGRGASRRRARLASHEK